MVTLDQPSSPHDPLAAPRVIYLDHAATTPLRPEARAAMAPFLETAYGNPSSIHAVGQVARRALDAARDSVARSIGARGEEILFTSGGTEADNLALTGVFLAASPARNHLITAATEHHAVLDTCEFLRGLGAEVTVLPVDGDGRVHPAAVAAAITPRTCLISIMAANNEIGTLAPIAELARVAREADVPFHTDAVQWVGALPLDVEALGVDLLTLSAHKFYGPKGVGALYVRRGTRLTPILHGGGQERGRRAGTENVAGIAGMARALGLAVTEIPSEAPRLTALRDRLLTALRDALPDVVLNGPPTDRLPNNLNVSFPGVDNELLLLNLDLEGVAVSAGSACTAGSLEPSHVIAALGASAERLRGSIRLSLGRTTSEAEIDAVVDRLVPMVRRLRP
jgi:cysteine desulfurase